MASFGTATSAAPVIDPSRPQALGRLEARFPLVGHQQVNWAMKLIPTVTGKVAIRALAEEGRLQGGHPILGLAGTRTRGPRRGRQQKARTTRTDFDSLFCCSFSSGVMPGPASPLSLSYAPVLVLCKP